VVVTASEMIRLQPGDPDRVRQRASQIVNGAKRMRQIIQVVVDYTYAQRAEGLPITPTEGVDFHGVCDRVIQGYRLLHPDRAIVYDAEGDPVGEWDEGRLEQVMQNLVGNAVKYGAPGSPITVRWFRDGDRLSADLVATVHNDGPPIPDELLPHVFEPFRSGRSRSEAGDSMGLGLFIVRQIVAAHGGEVSVTSDREHGTTFTVKLPARARPA
jgi:signal transduction histidine kinase